MRLPLLVALLLGAVQPKGSAQSEPSWPRYPRDQQLETAVTELLRAIR